MPAVYRGQKRTLDPLELKLQTVVCSSLFLQLCGVRYPVFTHLVQTWDQPFLQEYLVLVLSFIYFYFIGIDVLPAFMSV